MIFNINRLSILMRGVWFGCVLSIASLVNGCASVPMALPVAPLSAIPSVEQFWLDARLSVRAERYNQAPQQASGQLFWWHSVQDDRLRILSPFGQTLAELSRLADGRVFAMLANGHQLQAASLNELVAQSLGYSLPFDALSDWLVGQGSSRATVLRDTFQRPTLLQDGLWRVRYDYVDDGAVPSGLTIDSEEGIHLRLRVNQWIFGAPAEEKANHELSP